MDNKPLSPEIRRPPGVSSRADPPIPTVYILSTYPEITETFIDREIRGLVRAGVCVRVIAVRRGASPPARAGGVPEGRCSGGEVRVDYLQGSREHRLDPKTHAPGAGRHHGIPIGATPGKGPAEDGGARPARSSAGSGPSREPRPGGVPGLLLALGRDIARLGGHPRRSARAARLAVWALRARRFLPPGPCRLHAHFANDAAALARYLSALSGHPYRVTAHAWDLYQDPFLLGPNLRRAERVFTVSRANLEHLAAAAAKNGWDPARFALLRCGLDLSEFAWREPPPPRDPARLIAVARLVPKKGHGVLLDAVSALSAGGRRVELTLVGEGPLATELDRRLERTGLAPHVRRLGAVSNAEVRSLIASADLMVLASRIAPDGDRDGLPVALIEAMALGVPVIATRVAGIPELLDQGCGLVVSPDDPAGLAAAIRSALDEPQSERIARSRRARERIEAEYDLRTQIETLMRD